MNRGLRGLLSGMLLTSIASYAQLPPTKAYVIVMDCSGAPIYTATATVQVGHWTSHADVHGRIELTTMPTPSDVIIQAQGFRPLILKSDAPAVEQHRVVLDVGGGNTVEVQPSPTNPHPLGSESLQDKVSEATPENVPGRTVHISAGVIAASKVKGDLPRFPEAAKAQHVNGTVVMHVIIGSDGKVVEVAPISGPELLRKSCTDAVRQWEYRPYLLNGNAVQVDTTVTLSVSMGS